MPLARLGYMKRQSRITIPKDVDLTIRPPIAVDMGVSLKNYLCPHPDPQDPWTTIAGVVKRFAYRPPDPEPALMEKLREFTRRWLHDNLTPLSPDADTSVESWLANTNYPLWRKEELRARWAEVSNIRDPRYHECQSFMKDEWYMEYKHARAINSRSDEFKCYVGPIFKLIEEQLYKDPHFIKHVPVADRPQYIRRRLYRTGAKYYSSDYTSFEALFTKELMEAVEMQLYEYMSKYLPEGKEWMSVVREVLTGQNRCKFRDFIVELFATRMSGEMCTSLGNGFANLMLMLFMCAEKGCTDVDGVVEGDDGLFTMAGTAPTQDDFARLGLSIKLETHLELSSASFCGLIFDDEDVITVTDPRDVVTTFGWASARYAGSGRKTLEALLRCKSLSLAHQYPGCPIICALARYGLRITSSVPLRRLYRVMNSRKAMNSWERDQLMAALKDIRKIRTVSPPIRTRLLVEREFGIRVEHQIQIEKELDAANDWAPLRLELLQMYLPDCWRDYADRFVHSPVDIRRPPIQAARAPRQEFDATCVEMDRWLYPSDGPQCDAVFCKFTRRAKRRWQMSHSLPVVNYDNLA